MELNQIGGSRESPLLGGLNKTGMGKEDFLKLLITQLSHQDPMEPMDNQEFAAQLAQFSSLEQLGSIDSNIEQGIEVDLMLAQAINNTLAATVIGQNVKAVGDTIRLRDEGSVDASFRLDGFADEVEVTITDLSGNVVRKLSAQGLAEGEHSLEWDGKNADGETVEPGAYRFKVTASNSANGRVTATPLVLGTVTGVRYDSGSAVLLVNGEEISFGSVIEIGGNDQPQERE